ncbi:MAG: hypothetical protein ACOYL9_08200 [Ilumatobacteraceae bacterium]
MLLWFVATAVLTVHFVFTDPRFDHRFLILGVLLPDVVDGITGGAWVLHSLTGAVGLLVVVMLATIGRRPLRKRLIAIPIGVLLHLVFDFAFTSTDVFWWPFTGGFDGAPLPVVERGWWNVLLEAIGAALLVWSYRRFGLADPDRRRQFLRTGQLREI